MLFSPYQPNIWKKIWWSKGWVGYHFFYIAIK